MRGSVRWSCRARRYAAMAGCGVQLIRNPIFHIPITHGVGYCGLVSSICSIFDAMSTLSRLFCISDYGASLPLGYKPEFLTWLNHTNIRLTIRSKSSTGFP